MSIKYNNKTIAGYYKTEIIPNADTVNAGKIRIATQAEVDSGESNSTAVTPSYLSKKQDKLTAGKNITIENGVISADTTTGINVDGETISNENAVLSSIGTKTKSNTIKIDWEGTEAEYEAGLADGTISNDWYCYITDDETVVDFADHTELEVQNMYKTGNVSTDTTGYNQLVEMKSSGSKTGIDTVKIGSETVEIPYTLSKTGSKIVDVAYRDKVQALYNQEGKADYYTIDETNQNFTLPMGEIYGMKANSDLSNLTTAGEKHFLNKSQITNCLLEVPQRIKLELNNGVLTLKAGSVVIVPNGFEADGTTPKFDYVTVESDISRNNFSANGTTMIIVNFNNQGSGSNALGQALVSRVGSGTSDPNTGYYYRTNENKVYHLGNWYGYSLPIMVGTANGTTITSIDQVFNGMGYIGSTVWVDKGVKGLIPNGRNADGSLTNEEVTTDKLYIITIGNYTEPSTTLGYLTEKLWDNQLDYVPTSIIYEQNAKPSIASNYRWYDTINGKWYINDTGATVSKYSPLLKLADMSYVNGKITSFAPKLPFRALDYSDKTKITNWSFPSDKYIDLTLGASGTTYTAPADGWFILTGGVPTSSDVGHVTLINRLNTTSGTDGKFTVRCYGVGSPKVGLELYASVPAKAGDNVAASWAGKATATILRFIYAVGSEPTE